MGWLEAIVLGVTQGLTEFLPISSSAHLSIVGKLFFGGHDPGAAFTAVSQLGTETAVIIYFAKDIGRIISRWYLSLTGKIPRSDPDARMGWLVIIGSIPIVVLGYLLKSIISHELRNLWITAAMLIFIGLILLIADQHAKRNERDLDDLSWGHGLIYGCAQACALIPGVSRSGATISAGLFMGYSRSAATRYSFLLAIPAVFGSGLYELKDIKLEPNIAWPQVIVATLIAFIIGYIVIAWLIRYISHHNFKPFVIYRIVLGSFVLMMLLSGSLTA